ncbi:MAG: hypothetical protein ABIE14_02355, partial [Patescibacteria group bacterium]
MAYKNTQNPANPNPPAENKDVNAALPTPSAEKVSPPSELPELPELPELRETQPVAGAKIQQTPEATQPVADAEAQQAPISEAAEIPAEPETQTAEISAEEVEEIPMEEITEVKTTEVAPETQTESEIAQPEETQQVTAEETAEVPAEAPVPQTEEVAKISAEEIPETISQPQPEIQSEPEVVAYEEEIIQGAPAKPGDKTEAIFPPPPLAEPVSEVPPSSGAAAGNIPPKAEKSAQPKSGFKSDGITPLDGEEKIFAALGYVGILALLPLLTRRDSEFAQHHGRQGLVVAIIFIVLWLFAKLGDTLSNLVFVLQFAAIVGGFALA